ncbi:MAG: mandelate racemase/muconate lactonizing enzyme family protein [Chloroflexota bacterium]
MKITDVRALPLAIPTGASDRHSPWWARQGKQLIVQVLTDEGLVGLGEAFPYGNQAAVCRVILDNLKPLLLGQDPTRIEYLADLMQRSTGGFARRGLGMYAISGVEIALWDLLGKARGVPLYELLGGLTRPRLKAYASLLRYNTPPEVAEACRSRLAQGFSALKLHQIDVASVQAAREAVGLDVDIMLDTNCPWTPAEAAIMARALEPFSLAWLEEPIWPPEEYDGLARLRRQASMPIALGENEATAYGFREIIAKGAADILQPSVIKVGGVGELRRIAALAAAASLPVVPHSFYFGPGLAATLHVAATFTGAALVEYPSYDLEIPLLAEPITPGGGAVSPPIGPGLGVALNEEALRRYSVEL